MSDLYQEVIIEEFRHPQNYGQLPDADYVVRERNSSCGDEITIYLKVAADGQITDVMWEGTGCAISMAAMSALSGQLKNKTISDVKKLKQADIETLLGLTGISVGRVKCLMLGSAALRKISAER